MKITHYLSAIIIALMMAFSSCEEEVKYTLIVNNSVYVHEGSTTNNIVEAGNGGYTVTNSNPAVAAVKVEESGVSITGIKEGECELILKDASGQTTAITVVVGIPPTPFSKPLIDALSDFGLTHEETTNEVGKCLLTIKPDKAVKLAYNSSPVNAVFLSKTIINVLNNDEAKEKIVFENSPVQFDVIYNDDYYFVWITAIDTEATASGSYIKARK